MMLPALATIFRCLPALVGALLAAVSVTVQGADTPAQQLEPQPACLYTADEALSLTLEVATTNRQKQIGLMGRTSLPPNHGMLFVYERERRPDAGFWMYQTLLPLDIAWLDEQNVILAMATMPPCESRHSRDCPIYSPGVAHFHVLEMEAGFFESHHVRAGDRLELSPTHQTPCN